VAATTNVVITATSNGRATSKTFVVTH
jgi:hypothetical protein